MCCCFWWSQPPQIQEQALANLSFIHLFVGWNLVWKLENTCTQQKKKRQPVLRRPDFQLGPGNQILVESIMFVNLGLKGFP